MWAYNSIFYQIYPLGFCGAPQDNDGVVVNRVKKVVDWIPHIKKTGADAIYFCPVFSSDRHGYDTRDYRVVDGRLGTNADFAAVCEKLHKEGLRVVLDGVFNHVGRGFWAFQDVLQNRERSAYKDWFVNLRFDWDNGYHDGLSYEGWEGHYEMVKLNLQNDAVVSHLFGCIAGWVKEFDIDGIRLDVAYSLPLDFLSKLRIFCDALKPDFYLLGEVMHGDYNRVMNDEMLNSVTNYQAYKGLWSSFNSMNLFEINSTLEDHFLRKYVGKYPFNFVDNHDVERVASILTQPAHLKLIYALLFAIPGTPCIYYGSEWGALGKKEPSSDELLRPCFDKPIENELTAFIAACGAAHKKEKAFAYGTFQKVLLTNRQYIFERAFEGERILVAINADAVPFTAHFNANAGCATDLLTGQKHDFGGGSELPPYSAAYWKI
ncbi:MAG: alpha-amylase family glycosyl hydrolase [Ethanoligenens sp.]